MPCHSQFERDQELSVRLSQRIREQIVFLLDFEELVEVVRIAPQLNGSCSSTLWQFEELVELVCGKVVFWSRVNGADVAAPIVLGKHTERVGMN